LLVTKYGLEGGALYQLGRALRNMEKPSLEIDLKPSLTVEQLAGKIGNAKPLQLLDQATRAWRLSRAAAALLQLHVPFVSAATIAARAKVYPLELRGPRPIEEAISTAGGVGWEELDDHLMLKRLPGVFCAGEMIDWDAPTGGYLLQGCMSTATHAARGAVQFLGEKHESRKT
jgi:predicted flavoprotein YhiN